MQNEQVLSEFRKNATEEIRVTLTNYRGHDVIDIRVYFNSHSAEGELKSAKKGITMSTKLIPDLKKAIDRAYDQLNGDIHE